MQIPLNDLQAQFRNIKSEVMPAIEDVLDGMRLFFGPQNQQFEESFASYCGCEFGISVSNGTDAIALALRACHIGPGDEVITVSHTFIATAEAIAQVGATPIFVDIEPDTYTMDWRQLEGALSERTRVIIPIHLYGHPAEMQPIVEFARAHGLRVIEDASQAHGASYQGKRVGGFGDIACFSLYCSKNLGAYGEGGAVTTSNTPPSVPETRDISCLRSSWLRFSFTSVKTGTKAVENEPSANSRRMKLGMRKATQNASVAAFAPNTALMDISRTRPSTREIMVMLLNDSSPRNMLGDFMPLMVPLLE